MDSGYNDVDIYINVYDRMHKHSILNSVQNVTLTQKGI